MNILEQNIDKIRDLCKLNNVSSLFAFGSVLTSSFRSDSDIDLVVDIDDRDPLTYSDKYFNLKFQLEEILRRQIDLLEYKSIRNKFLRSEIDRSKIQIYERDNTNLA
ncbi:MAG: nucleotidyltransferase domain-containing protein [Bacteroidales bacterium]|nr:nucleotidyltransferase domain-containing protein [Bacteroidales bacterium]